MLRVAALLLAMLLHATAARAQPAGCAPELLSLRLAYVDFDGGAALEAAAAVPGDGPLDDAFVRTRCAGVTEAIDRMCGWITRGAPAT